MWPFDSNKPATPNPLSPAGQKLKDLMLKGEWSIISNGLICYGIIISLNDENRFCVSWDGHNLSLTNEDKVQLKEVFNETYQRARENEYNKSQKKLSKAVDKAFGWRKNPFEA